MSRKMVHTCRIRTDRHSAWHRLTRAKDGSVYCDCPAWRFQHKPARKRTCKHLKLAKRLGRI